MKKTLTLISTIILTTCSSAQSNTEIVQKYMRLEMGGSTDELAELLTDDLVVVFEDGVEMDKQSVSSNHDFNIPYNPWNKIIFLEELNDSTIKIHALETNELNQIFKIDTIAYAHQFTLTDSRISKIEIGIIPNSGYNYGASDSIYNSKLAELFDWMSLVYPKEFEQIDGLNSKSAEIILKKAKEKEDNNH
ncbi:MAG: hypothetical protein AAGF85_09430 [Bacteroidota bacterium]